MNLFEKAVKNISPLNREAMNQVSQRLDSLAKPPGSLGMLEKIAIQLGGITGDVFPRVDKKLVAIMAGDHGVVKEGVSAFPSEVTPQMIFNFLSDGAAINVLTKHSGGDIICVDVGVASDIKSDDARFINRKVKYGTDNMAEGPAMSRDEAIAAVQVGIEVVSQQVKKGVQLFGTGEMGIGNTTPSSAILKVYSDLPIRELVGRGTGLDDNRLKLKIDTIEKAIELNKPDPKDAIDVLSKVGGLEIAGIAGLILGAAYNKVPIVIDGFISTAGALIASKIQPKSVDYMIASHVSQEPGHIEMLKLIGLKPILHMDMRLGEGTGGALAFHIVEGATKILKEMATFQDAGVSGAL